MNRIEFSRKQRRFIWERAGGHCEKCKSTLKTSEGQYDHVIPIAQGGPTEIDNGQLLCRVCHGKKTGIDKGATEKVKRIHDKHLGIFPKSRAPLQSRGFGSTRLWQPGTSEGD